MFLRKSKYDQIKSNQNYYSPFVTELGLQGWNMFLRKSKYDAELEYILTQVQISPKINVIFFIEIKMHKHTRNHEIENLRLYIL